MNNAQTMALLAKLDRMVFLLERVRSIVADIRDEVHDTESCEESNEMEPIGLVLAILFVVAMAYVWGHKDGKEEGYNSGYMDGSDMATRISAALKSGDRDLFRKGDEREAVGG